MTYIAAILAVRPGLFAAGTLALSPRPNDTITAVDPELSKSLSNFA
ncbi:MAG: hypothetical protein ACLP3K_18270 [Candidatus Acidiferrales bacterium]